MSDGEVFLEEPVVGGDLPDTLRQQDEQIVSRNLTAARTINPDEHAAALRVAVLHGIDVNAARAALRGGLQEKQDAAQTQAAANDDPAFRAWLTDPNNAALASDAMEETRKLSQAMGNTVSPFAPTFIDDLFRAADIGSLQLDRMVRNLRVNMGWIDPDRAADEEATIAKVIAARQKGFSGATKAQQREIEEASGFWDTAGAFFANPRAAATEIVQSTVSSSDAIVAGIFTGGVGAVGVGALGGSAVVGGLAGAAVGNLSVETATEAGAWFQDALRRRGYDPDDAASLRTAYKDPELMSSAWAESVRYGLGVATVDTASLFLAGARLSGAKGMLKKALAAGRELGEQAVLGGLSEVTGDIASVGSVDWKAVALESAAGTGQQSLQIGFGAILRRAGMKDDGSEVARSAVKAAKDAAQSITKADALDAAKTAYQKSKLRTRSPERAWALMNEAAGESGVTEVRISRETWDAHWTAQNRSPASVAAAVFFGGDEAYHAAANTGEIVFPVGPYMDTIGQTPDWDALLGDLRLGENEPTANEGTAELEAREEGLKEANKDRVLFQTELEKLEEESAKLGEEIKAAETPAPEVPVAVDMAKRAEQIATVLADQRARLETKRAGGNEPASEQYLLDSIAGLEKGAAMSEAEVVAEETEHREFRAGLRREGKQITERRNAERVAATRAEAAASGAREPTPAERIQLLRDNIKEAQTFLSDPSLAETAKAEIAQAEADIATLEAGGEVAAEAPEAPSAGGVEAKKERQKAIAARISQLVAQSQANKGVAEGLRATLEKNLIEAGRKKAESRLHATLWTRMLSVVAERTGKPLEEVGRRFLLDVREGQEGETGGLEHEGAKRRGALKIEKLGSGALYTLSFYQTANKSTFLHETAHAFLDIMAILAAEADAAPQLAADYAATLSYLGAQPGQELTREQHETFARSFEAYLLKGEAPSPEVRRMFATFRDWLVKLYKNESGLRVTLSPEIREVFDRLVATDEEIAQARYEAGTDITLPAEIVAAMTPEAQAAYHAAQAAAKQAETEELGKDLLKSLTKERLAAFKARVDALAPKIKKQIDESPSGRALKAIRDGKAPKMDRAGAEKVYSKETVKRLEDAHLLAGNGMAPDAMASMLEQSLDAMASGLIGAENAEAVSRQLAAQQVNAESPDLVTEPARKRLAKKAAALDERAKALEIEAAALQAALNLEEGERRTARDDVKPLAEVRAEVQRDLDRLPVNLLNPKGALAASQRSARQAFKHAVAKDYRFALQAKNQERYNFERARISALMQEAARKHTAYAAGMNGETRQKRLTKAGPTYRDRMNDILFHYGLREKGSGSADPRDALRAWIAQRSGEDDGRVPRFTDAILAGEPRAWGGMTLSEMEVVRKAIQQVWEMARSDEEFLAAGHKADLDATSVEAIGALKATGRKFKTKPKLGQTKEQKQTQRWKNLAAALIKVPELMRRADNEVDGGAWWRVLVRPFNVGFDWKREVSTSINKGLAEAKRKAFTQEQLKDFETKRDVEGVSEKVSHADRIMVLLNVMNEGNYSRLVKQYDEEGKRISGNFDESEIAAILAQATDQDIAYAEAVAGAFAGLWPLVKDMEERVTGATPEAVEVRDYSFKRADGSTATIKGAYFPIVYGDIRGEEMAAEQMAKELGRAVTGRAMTGHGHTKARLELVGRPLLLDTAVIEQALSHVIHDLAFREALIDANRFLAHRSQGDDGNVHNDVQEALTGYFGEEVYNQVKSMLADIASNDTRFYESSDWYAARLRRGISAAVLGGKLSTALINTTGFVQSIQRIGGKEGNANGAMWMRRAVQEMTTPVVTNGMLAFVLEHSKVMPGRASNLTREIAEQARLTKDGKQAKVEAFNWYMYGRTQIFVDGLTWYAAYLKASEAHPDDLELAADIADSVVREAQGTGDLIDLSAFQRGSEWRKWATIFYHYASTTLSRANASWSNLRVKDPETYARFLADNAILFILPSAISYGLKQALGKLRGDDDDDDGVVAGIGREVGANVMNVVPWLRDGASMFYGLEARNANLKPVEQIGNVAKQLWAVMPGTEAEFEPLKAITSTNMLFGIWTAYGADQINQGIEGMAAWMDGQSGAGPQSLILGPPRNR